MPPSQWLGKQWFYSLATVASIACFRVDEMLYFGAIVGPAIRSGASRVTTPEGLNHKMIESVIL